MSRTTLISASALLLAISSVHAADAKIGAGIQLPGVAVQSEASAGVDLKASKEAAVKAAQSSRDAAITAGVTGIAGGKSAADSARDAAASASANAKASGQAAADKAKADLQARSGQTQAVAAGYKQDAAQAITLKDRLALGKHFGAAKATGKAVTALFGASANAEGSAALPKGYESKLVIGAKLDADLAAKGTVIDSAIVKGLSAQPKGTELVKVGERAVRIDSKTRIVLDVTSI